MTFLNHGMRKSEMPIEKTDSYIGKQFQKISEKKNSYKEGGGGKKEG